LDLREQRLGLQTESFVNQLYTTTVTSSATYDVIGSIVTH
jgi:hypothetical protein